MYAFGHSLTSAAGRRIPGRLAQDLVEGTTFNQMLSQSVCLSPSLFVCLSLEHKQKFMQLKLIPSWRKTRQLGCLCCSCAQKGSTSGWQTAHLSTSFARCLRPASLRVSPFLPPAWSLGLTWKIPCGASCQNTSKSSLWLRLNSAGQQDRRRCIHCPFVSLEKDKIGKSAEMENGFFFRYTMVLFGDAPFACRTTCGCQEWRKAPKFSEHRHVHGEHRLNESPSSDLFLQSRKIDVSGGWKRIVSCNISEKKWKNGSFYVSSATLFHSSCWFPDT